MGSIRKIRTGVIGVGSMGQNHARIYNDISNLVGVSDPNKEQGCRVAERFGIPWYEDFHDMLDSVDAVTIAVPTSLHVEVAKSVADAGVHMLVEKPLSGNVADAEAIVTMAGAAGVTLAVGHVERHNEVIEYAKTCIEKGEWGEILTLSAKRLSNYPSRIHDVGVLFDLTIHDVDIIRYLFNVDIRSVFTTGVRLKNERYEDHVNMLMEFENGKIGNCETNWLTPMKVRELDITTTKGFIKINYLTQEIEIFSSKFGKVDESNLFQPPIEVNKQKISLKGTEPLKKELVDFLESILYKRRPLVDGEDGLKAVQIVEAGLESLNSSIVINLK